MNKAENSFKFYTPITFSKGGVSADGKEEWIIAGIASTADKDADGEFLDPKGFDIDDFLKLGFVNWHHQTEESPAAIVGEPKEAKITKDGFYVATLLYPSSKKAQEIWELSHTLEKDSKTRRLGYSIEGVVLERESDNPNDEGYNRIKKAKITGLAITHMPKNAKTFAEILKGGIGKNVEKNNDEEDKKNVKKDLNTENGAALKRESVDGKLKEIVKGYEIKDFESDEALYEEIYNTFTNITPTNAEKVFTIIKSLKMKLDDKKIQKAMEALGLSVDEKNPFLKKGKKAKKIDDKDDIDFIIESENIEIDDLPDDEDIETFYGMKDEKGNVKKGSNTLILKALSAIHKENRKGQQALAVLVKSTLEKNNDLVETVNKQQEIIKGLERNIKRISLASKGRKSIVKSYREKETFKKGEMKNANVLSKSQNKAQILDILDAATFGADGSFDQTFSKATTLFETSGVLLPEVIQRLKMEKGITIVD